MMNKITFNKPLLIDILAITLIIISLLTVSIPFLKVIVAAVIVGLHKLITKKRSLNFQFDYLNLYRIILITSIIALVIVIMTHYIVIPVLYEITNQKIDFSIVSGIKGNAIQFILFLSIGWVIGGVMEEIVFRGFLYNRISKYIPGKVGVIIGVLATSALFGYLHQYQGFAGQLLTGITGVIMCLVYIHFKNKIIYAIFTHGLINTISMTSVYLGLIEA